jgi:peptidoglycan/LPS O-acetylase OafA/YrhL
VVLGHAFPNVLSGGFVGVDIFFVISGFLIAGIIIREIEADRFSIANFYRRRVRRIFPALCVVVLFTAIAGYFLLSPLAYRELARTVVATMLFVSNIDFWRTTGYFDGIAASKPLLHMWSLAVEEQFYILFPPLLYVVWKKQGRTRSVAILALIMVASIVLTELIRPHWPAAAYYLLPSRAFELLVGCILATGYIPAIKPDWARHAYSVLGLVLILAPMGIYTSATPFPGLTALVPCLGAGMLIHAGQFSSASVVGRAISVQPLRFLGDISYSLYLWHWPVLAYLRSVYGVDLPVSFAAGAIAVALAGATLSYYFVEQPFLNEKARRLPYLRLGTASIMAYSLMAGLVYLSHGLPIRFSPQANALFAAADDYNTKRLGCHDEGLGKPAPYSANCTFGADGVKADTVVWGDSHGAELAVVLGDRAKEIGRSVMEITSSACPPAMDFAVPERPYCRAHNRITLDGLRADRSVKTVVLVANSLRYADQRALTEGLQVSVAALKGAGKTVVLVKQIPTMDVDPPSRLGLLYAWGRDIQRTGIQAPTYHATVAGWDGFLDKLAADQGMQTFDPSRYICDDEVCRMYDPAIGVLFFNPDHLSIKGATAVFNDLADSIYGAAPYPKEAVYSLPAVVR